MSRDTVDRVVRYIEANRDGDDDSLVFFGGEPLLVPDIIERFIDETGSLGLRYILFTNGVLLNRVPLELLRKLNIIFVSVDGDRESNEKHRVAGTYDGIMRNIEYLKDSTDAYLIGRVTVEEETNVDLSVRNLLRLVDAVYWQIVNKPAFNDSRSFVRKYKAEVRRLFEYWMENLSAGRNPGIVPFQAVAASVLFGYPEDRRSFRCGSGHSYQAIDVDGNVYFCDEYVGDRRGIVGNIAEGAVDLRYKAHFEIFDDCLDCEVSDICLGRCRKFLSEYNDEHKRVYCEMTRGLINLFKEERDRIEEIVKKHSWDLSSIYRVPKCTEEIP